MANKRMFSLKVVDTDRFTEMPTSSQALYFHLGMHGDDDDFVDSPKKIVRSVGCSEDDLRILISKGYLIPFESGVVVIRDWRVNNNLQNDRYHATIYKKEMACISLGEDQKYNRKELSVPNLDTSCIQDRSISETELNTMFCRTSRKTTRKLCGRNRTLRKHLVTFGSITRASDGFRSTTRLLRLRFRLRKRRFDTRCGTGIWSRL